MKPLRRFVFENFNINEGISKGNVDRYFGIVDKFAKKNGLVTHRSIINANVDGEQSDCLFLFSAKTLTQNDGVLLVWNASGNYNYLDKILFTSNAQEFYNNIIFGGTLDFDCCVGLNDVSLVSILPLLAELIKNPKNTEEIIVKFYDIRDSNKMYESAENIEQLRRKANSLSATTSTYKKNFGESDPRYIEKRRELEEIRNKIKNSVTVSGRTTVTTEPIADFNALEEELEERATPEERFSDMEHYIKMVIRGVQPSLLISGAPGVGKTFRVTKALKESGKNYFVVKGKCTPMALYQYLFQYSRPGDILVFDDADEIITNEVITNLLKAATDSSDERLVSYGTSKAPMMSETEYMELRPELREQVQIEEIRKTEYYFYPKRFVTQGAIIIITNMRAGQVDTAVRNRALICDLSFTVEENLQIIESLLPFIGNGLIDNNAKKRAFNYLKNLAEGNKPVEISMRSFTTVAKVYSDVTDERQAQRMINEQMKLQSMRGGKKY
jgi:hypothetical protein